MDNFKYLRMFYQLAVLTIFLIQSKQSLDKYLEYPVVVQKSSTTIKAVEKPDIQVCFDSFFDYDEAAKLGYDWRTSLMAGMLPNSSIPSWKGKYGNYTFQEIQDLVYEKTLAKLQ